MIKTFTKEVLSVVCLLSIIFVTFVLLKRDYEKEELISEINSLMFENKILYSVIENQK